MKAWNRRVGRMLGMAALALALVALLCPAVGLAQVQADASTGKSAKSAKSTGATKPTQAGAEKPGKKPSVRSISGGGSSEEEPEPLRVPIIEMIDDLPANGQPRAVVEEPIKDFGEHWVGPVLRHSFLIRNEGDAPLKIIQVRPGCGCTKAGLTPTEVAPGETGEFPFKLDSNKLFAKYRKPITISTNDPITPDIKLWLVGDCRRYVEIQPANASFGRVTTKEAKTKLLTIKNNASQPLQLTVPPPQEGSGFTYELEEVEPGQRYNLTVSTVTPHQPGNLKGDIVLATNLLEQPTATIHVLGSFPARLDVNPPKLRLFQPVAGRPLTRPLNFTNFSEHPVKVLGVSSDDPDMELTVSEVEAGRRYRINVAVPADYQLPKQDRTIVIQTDDAELPEITVPVIAQHMPDFQPTKPTAPASSAQRPAEQMLGMAVPDFSTETHAGQPFTSADLKGTVTVLDFVALNCKYCNKQLPRIETIRTRYAEKGVRFVTVAETMRKKLTPEEIVAKCSELGVQSDLVLDPANVLGKQFRVTSFPSMFVVDRQGKVASVVLGNRGDLESYVSGELNRLLATMGRVETESSSAGPSSSPSVGTGVSTGTRRPGT